MTGLDLALTLSRPTKGLLVFLSFRNLGRNHEAGMIIGMGTDSGTSADFVVLDANPLDDITNTRRISQVYLRGEEIDREALRAKFMGES